MEENKTLNMIKMFSFAAIGIFFFFVSIKIGEKSSIPLDHLVSFFKDTFPEAVKYYAYLVIIAGGVYPFIKGTWKDTQVDMVLSCLKVLGIIFASMYIFKIGPAFLFEKGMLPFLFEKLVISVGLIVPIGAIFLSFLIDYGLLELVGVIMQPVMRKIWKTPGKSAIDAVASFVGSYSIGLLITGKVYKDGGYSLKEASIIATGFSTVSATFMIIVAKTLGLMHIWGTYFWVTIVVTFAVTAISARIYPIRNMAHFSEEELHSRDSSKEGEGALQRALDEGLEKCVAAGSTLNNIKSNFIAGFIMTMGILASIMSVGTIGLILANYTPFFDILGYIFYPVAWLTQIPDALEFSKAAASSLAEMFLPALILKEAELISRFVAGVVSISSVLFFSASIPCILSTGIPISIKDMVIIWVERVLLTILIAAPIAHLLVYLNILV